jgi:hypothetical protein
MDPTPPLIAGLFVEQPLYSLRRFSAWTVPLLTPDAVFLGLVCPTVVFRLQPSNQLFISAENGIQ